MHNREKKIFLYLVSHWHSLAELLRPYGSSDPSLFVQREGQALPEASLPFHRAMPSLTHMALVELEKAGILKFLISQVWLYHVIL